MNPKHFFPSRVMFFLVAVLILGGLYLASLYSYLLFHALVELATMIVAGGIFVVVWNTHRLNDNNYLLFLGIAYLFIALIDLVHTLAYKGMGVFPEYDANLPTQLWIAARYLQGFSLLIAPFFLRRKMNPIYLALGFALVTTLLLLSIFVWQIFPVCYIEGIGLTPFKIISEYVISAILLVAIALLFRKRAEFDPQVFALLVSSLALTIGAELAFTAYVSVYGLANLAGHFFKLFAFYLIYKAVIETGLTKPYALLFRDLANSREALQHANDTLEQQVRARTAELAMANTLLRDSQARFQEVLENSLDAAYKRNLLTNRYEYLSPVFTRISGYTPDEFINLPLDAVLDVMHPDDLVEFNRVLAESMTGPIGTAYQIEYRFKHKDGVYRWFQDRFTVMRDANEHTAARIGSVSDITERKRAEEALRESEKQYRRLINILPSGVVVHSQGQIVLVNRASNRYFGARQTEQLIGTPVVERVDPSSHTLVRERIRQSHEWGVEMEPVEEKLVRLDGQTFDAEVSSIALNYAGQPATLAVFTDISERRQRERELEAVANMSVALRNAGNRAAMLPIIAHQVCNLVDAASVALLFNDERTNDFVIEHAQGIWACDQGKHLPRSAGILREVLAHGKPYLTNDLAHDPNFFYRHSIRDLRGMVEIPLRTHETIIGFLAVATRREFTEQDVRVLTAICDIAANAIHRATLYEQTQRDAAQLALAYDTTLEGWARALELRDHETEGHTRRVVEMTLILARTMGLAENELEQIWRGALLHDIGKMGIPDSILLKPGELSEQEWQVMRRHPEYGYQLLLPIDYLRPAIDIPYCHHEKWDGTGYPRSLQGEMIPLAARIFAVVDVWDAIRSDRPYRKAWNGAQVRQYLQEQAGKHFDPQVVEAFLKIV